MRSFQFGFSVVVIAFAACSSDVTRPGSPGGTGSDGSLPRDGANAMDAGSHDDARAPDDSGSNDRGLTDRGMADSGSRPDALDEFDGALAFDGAFPEVGVGFDTSFPEVGVGFDSSFPEIGGLFDGSIPEIGGFFDGSIPELGGFFDIGGARQTNVVLDRASIQVWMNLQPVVQPDPLHFLAALQYDNTGSTPETVSVTRASITIISGGVLNQQFMVQPDHVAPPGLSTKMVSKVIGSGSVNIPNAATYCMTNAVISLTLSTGQPLFGTATVNCVF